jgi:hypothetical protein
MSKRNNPDKEKWFNDLPADEQIAIEKREEKIREQLWAKFKTAGDQNNEGSDESFKKEEEKIESLNNRLFPYFQLKAHYCENKKDALEFFFIWIVSQGALRTIVELSSEGEFVDGYVESFYRFFIINNAKKEDILPPKIALKRFFWGIYEGHSKIYEEMKKEGYMFKEDNR